MAETRENAAARQFEVWVDDRLAGYTQYRVDDEQTYTFFHTEVDAAFEGQGLASQLIGSALDTMKERGIAVRPTCPFVRRFIRRHADYEHLVPESDRARFGLS